MQDLLIRRMFDLGWSAFKSLDKALENPETLEQEKAKYAAFHNVDVTDIDDHILEPRICGLPDIMPLAASVCKWPDPNVTWDIVADIRGLTRQQVIEGVTEAFNRWAKVCGVRPSFTPGNPNARITIGSRNIDGPMGVLAESELPCGNVRRCRQWYDNGDPWAMFNGSGSGNQIDFIRVAMHELGHALGMGHIGAGNLLAPTYSRSIWEAKSGDISEMQSRYGPPVSQPPPPPPSQGLVIRVVDGLPYIDGYRVTKLLSTEE